MDLRHRLTLTEPHLYSVQHKFLSLLLNQFLCWVCLHVGSTSVSFGIPDYFSSSIFINKNKHVLQQNTESTYDLSMYAWLLFVNEVKCVALICTGLQFTINSLCFHVLYHLGHRNL